MLHWTRGTDLAVLILTLNTYACYELDAGGFPTLQGSRKDEPALDPGCTKWYKDNELTRNLRTSPIIIDWPAYNDIEGRRSIEPVYKKQNRKENGSGFFGNIARRYKDIQLARNLKRFGLPGTYTYNTGAKWPFLMSPDSSLRRKELRIGNDIWSMNEMSQNLRSKDDANYLPSLDKQSTDEASFSLENRIQRLGVNMPTSEPDDLAVGRDNDDGDEETSSSSEESTEDEASVLIDKLAEKTTEPNLPFLQKIVLHKSHRMPKMSKPNLNHYNSAEIRSGSWSGTSVDGADSWNINILKFNKLPATPTSENG